MKAGSRALLLSMGAGGLLVIAIVRLLPRGPTDEVLPHDTGLERSIGSEELPIPTPGSTSLEDPGEAAPRDQQGPAVPAGGVLQRDPGEFADLERKYAGRTLLDIITARKEKGLELRRTTDEVIDARIRAGQFRLAAPGEQVSATHPGWTFGEQGGRGPDGTVVRKVTEFDPRTEESVKDVYREVNWLQRRIHELGGDEVARELSLIGEPR